MIFTPLYAGFDNGISHTLQIMIVFGLKQTELETFVPQVTRK